MTKRPLQLGAGLVGGAALLAGGVFAYKKHEEHKEEVPFRYNFFAIKIVSTKLPHLLEEGRNLGPW